jgi:predicted glycosyltransferase
VLVDKPPEKTAWMAELAALSYDRVLVHGDPALIAFEATFPQAAAIAGKLHYTGYVVGDPPAAADPEAGRGEVLVSAGGGAFGERLLTSALAARPLSRLAAAPWRLLAGTNLPAPALAALRRQADAGVVVERSRADFQALLANCRLSISLAGYNTTVEVLRSGAPAVLVPYAGGRETEQSRRARLLAARDAVTLVEEAELSPDRLAAAIDDADARGRRETPGLRLDGARDTSAAILALAAIVPE